MPQYDIWYKHGRPVLMKDKREMTIADVLKDLKATDAQRPLVSTEAPCCNAKTFSMPIEPHTPSDPSRPCYECVLQHGIMCLDRSYCEFKQTGKTWRKVAV